MTSDLGDPSQMDDWYHEMDRLEKMTSSSFKWPISKNDLYHEMGVTNVLMT